MILAWISHNVIWVFCTRQILANKMYYEMSFFPHNVKDWNSLPTTLLINSKKQQKRTQKCLLKCWILELQMRLWTSKYFFIVAFLYFMFLIMFADILFTYFVISPTPYWCYLCPQTWDCSSSHQRFWNIYIVFIENILMYSWIFYYTLRK